MRIETSKHDNAMRIKLQDRMSFSDHGLFREVLTSIRAGNPKSCVLDLSELVSVDSAGLGMLMVAHEASKKEGWALSLQAPQPQVLKLLELTCFDKILSITR